MHVQTTTPPLVSLSLRTLFVLLTLLCVVFWRFFHHRQEQIAVRERLLQQYQQSSILLTFGSEVAGFALPDAHFHQGFYGNGRSKLPPDPWTFLRPAAAPYVRAAVVYSDPDPVLPQGYQRVVQAACRR